MVTYAEKLRNPKWQKKRLHILERDGWKCRFCSDGDEPLNVHHKKYSGDPHEADDEMLLSLCDTCHDMIENIKRLDKEYNKDHANHIVSCCKVKSFLFVRLDGGAIFLHNKDAGYLGVLQTISELERVCDFLTNKSDSNHAG